MAVALHCLIENRKTTLGPDRGKTLGQGDGFHHADARSNDPRTGVAPLLPEV